MHTDLIQCLHVNPNSCINHRTSQRGYLLLFHTVFIHRLLRVIPVQNTNSGLLFFIYVEHAQIDTSFWIDLNGGVSTNSQFQTPSHLHRSKDILRDSRERRIRSTTNTQ